MSNLLNLKVKRNDLGRNWYGSILSNRELFRRSGGTTDDISKTDNPNTYFFKLMFYFENNGEEGDAMQSNLLSMNWSKEMTGYKALPWDEFKDNTNTSVVSNIIGGIKTGNSKSVDIIDKLSNIIKDNNVSLRSNTSSDSNTALNYLLLNNELERAEKLTKFIKLLSNISIYSPWYFQSIEGLQDALERQSVGKEFAVKEERESITISCLPDAVDSRIGTLIDLYRDIVYSHIQNKEILPANLRKFDMGLYIFSEPIRDLHTKSNIFGEKEYASFDEDSNNYRTSCKYIEFQNCEIDYDSISSGYTEISNESGFDINYKIKIYFDNVMESRYNEFITRKIGDFIEWDMIFGNDPTFQVDNVSALEDTNNRLDKNKSILNKLAGQLVGHAKEDIKGLVNKVFLGNLHGFSISSIRDVANRFTSGNIVGGISSIVSSGRKNKNDIPTKIGQNMHIGYPKTRNSNGWKELPRKFSENS